MKVSILNLLASSFCLGGVLAAEFQGKLASPQKDAPPVTNLLVVFKPDATEDQINHVQTVLSGAMPQTQRSPGEKLEPKILGDISKQNSFRGMSIPLVPKSKDRNIANMAKADSNQLDQLQKMAADLPGVKFVEPDHWARASQISSQPFPISWGLRRISSRRRPIPPFYFYPSSAGNGTNVYILDTGVMASHKEFQANPVQFIYDFTGYGAGDVYGHGTLVAGVVGGFTTGVAKRANMFDIKVLDDFGWGEYSWVIAGILYAMEHCLDSTQTKRCVINMSLGGPTSYALNDVVQYAVESGLVVVSSAGNEADNACDYSPASGENGVTVGSSTLFDKISSFSNYGKCVDVFAPGEFIYTSGIPDWCGAMDCYLQVSGTSLAAPHVAGIAALYWTLKPEITNPMDINDLVRSSATSGILSQFPDTESPNLLAFNLPVPYQAVTPAQ